MKNQKNTPSFWHQFIPISFSTLFRNYSWNFFRSDLIAGVTVGVVALPLAMAFAIASGVPPIYGLYTAIVAGFLASLFGGSQHQITGPTGAFVIVIYAIMQEQGYNSLVIATLLAGVFLLIAAFAKLGALIRFIPYPLVTGFTTGIALVIFTSQIKDFFGLHLPIMPVHFLPKCAALYQAFPSFSGAATCIGVGTLALILVIRTFIPIIPWAITSITVATAICWGFGVPVETIYSRFGEIPSTIPLPSWPHFEELITNWYTLFQSAITIAFLAGIESLLSATVADGMTGKTHKSNAELLGQGIANIGSVLFGGIPATGAIARTAMNIKSHAKTPLSGIVHSITLLLIVLTFAPIASQIPLPALSAVLFVVAWNMSELRHFRHMFRAPPADIAILLTTFFLTVLVDLIVAIEVGMILAAFLFMKRVRDLSGVHSLQVLAEEKEKEGKPDPDAIELKRIPPGVEVYEIRGLFFFSLAETLNGILSNFESSPKVFILRLRHIPVIDASGMYALREFYEKCKRGKTTLILSGVKPPVLKSLQKFGLVDLIGPEHLFPHIDPALEKSAALVSLK